MIMAWKPNGFSNECIKPPATSGYSLDMTLDYFNNPTF